jgi:hypothetical protein
MLFVDDFILAGGAFCTCLLCGSGLELSSRALEHYRGFEHIAVPPHSDQCILIPLHILEN